MSFRLDRVHVWSCEVPDEAGGVAAKLHALAEAGANLQYVGTRRQPDKPGSGILYIAPVSGPEQQRAAKAVGLREVFNPVIVRGQIVRQLDEGWILLTRQCLEGLACLCEYLTAGRAGCAGERGKPSFIGGKLIDEIVGVIRGARGLLP